MSLQVIISWLIGITALAAFINHKFFKLPDSIGITLVTLIISLIIIFLGFLGLQINIHIEKVFASFDPSSAVLDVLLSFLLFAGSLHVNILDLAKHKYIIMMLASFGVIFSTLIVGFLMWFVAGFFHYDLPLEYCLLFGALISPTDPIAVLGVLKKLKAPKVLETKIMGEALFNDGVGIVLFITLLKIADSGIYLEHFSWHHTGILFFREVIGGIVVGYLLAKVAQLFIKASKDYEVVLFITLALVTGGYTMALNLFHVSGPIAMAMAGLVIGNTCRDVDMQKFDIEKLDSFWDMVDELLNSILFVLIGLEALFLSFDLKNLVLGVIAIPIVLIARYISVLIPVVLTSNKRNKLEQSKLVSILTWGGLRGGVSIALALLLPEGHYRDLIIGITYSVVIFSIMVQGLTIGKFIQKLYPSCGD